MTEKVDRKSVLVIGPTGGSVDLLKRLDEASRYRIVVHSDLDDISTVISTEKVDLLLIEENPGDMNLVEMVVAVRRVDPDLPILVVAEFDDDEARGHFWRIGADDCVSPEVADIELNHRVRKLLKTRDLSLRCDELTRENRNLWELAVTDGLTRLMNRRRYMELIGTEFARAKRFNNGLGVIMCDIDHFKSVNDTYGHLTGDRILRQLADILRTSIRTIDHVARYGGEEFVFLMPETIGEGLVFAGEKIRSAVQASNFRDTDDIKNPGPERVTISLGAAAIPDCEVKTHEELLSLADKALYEAKDGGRNRIVKAAC